MSEDIETQNTETPYVVAALICERALQEKDGVISLIRLVDTVNTTFTPSSEEEAAKPTPAIPLALSLFISFRAGPARGKREIVVHLYDPDGAQKFQTGPYPMVFTSAEQGHNLNIKMSLALKNPGVYWIDVVIDGRVVTRLPLTVTLTIRPPEQTEQPSQNPKTAE